MLQFAPCRKPNKLKDLVHILNRNKIEVRLVLMSASRHPPTTELQMSMLPAHTKAEADTAVLAEISVNNTRLLPSLFASLSHRAQCCPEQHRHAAGG